MYVKILPALTAAQMHWLVILGVWYLVLGPADAWILPVVEGGRQSGRFHEERERGGHAHLMGKLPAFMNRSFMDLIMNHAHVFSWNLLAQ